MSITECLRAVFNLAIYGEDDVTLVVEDARQRKWIPNTGDPRREAGRRKGAGSVCRDSQIWEGFANELKIPVILVAPKDNCTKLPAEQFADITCWDQRTSQHSRDAAMLVFGR